MKTYEITRINGKQYRVYKMLNSWDTNYHFVDKYGVDNLVDLQDVIEWVNENATDDSEILGASVQDAIAFAKDMAFNDDNGIFWWKQD